MAVPYQEWRDVEAPVKQAWGPGPWQEEPDKVQWEDEVTGLACLAVRNAYSGNWCGYVGVNDKHPLYGTPYQQVDDRYDVHGGLTFSDKCHGRICHHAVPEEEVWWFGFDCGHAFDHQPGLMASLRRDMPEFVREHGDYMSPGEVYRTLDYVRDQCRDLAVQIKAAS